MSVDEASALRRRALAIGFDDGGRTVGSVSKNIKKNRQLTLDTPEARPLLNEIKSHILTCSPLCIYALPREIINIMINDYGPGDAYGWHTDNPYILGKRTDVSFTLFLTNHTDYEGGELEIRRGQYVTHIKGQAGQVAVYGTGDLHQVKPVTRGNRVSVVGWITSWIGCNADREMLFEMQQELNRLAGKYGVAEIELLSRTYQHLSKRLSY